MHAPFLAAVERQRLYNHPLGRSAGRRDSLPLAKSATLPFSALIALYAADDAPRPATLQPVTLVTHHCILGGLHFGVIPLCALLRFSRGLLVLRRRMSWLTSHSRHAVGASRATGSQASTGMKRPESQH